MALPGSRLSTATKARRKAGMGSLLTGVWARGPVATERLPRVHGRRLSAKHLPRQEACRSGRRTEQCRLQPAAGAQRPAEDVQARLAAEVEDPEELELPGHF